MFEADGEELKTFLYACLAAFPVVIIWFIVLMSILIFAPRRWSGPYCVELPSGMKVRGWWVCEPFWRDDTGALVTTPFKSVRKGECD